jgi:dihydropteroate synthase
VSPSIRPRNPGCGAVWPLPLYELALMTADRVWGTAATVAWSIANGASISRVHDVEAMAKVVKMCRAIMEAPS